MERWEPKEWGTYASAKVAKDVKYFVNFHSISYKNVDLVMLIHHFFRCCPDTTEPTEPTEPDVTTTTTGTTNPTTPDVTTTEPATSGQTGVRSLK